jgi:hypothetical protein
MKKKFIKNCLKCNTEFIVLRDSKFNFRETKQEKKHCSYKCSNSRVWTPELKNKLSESVKNSELCKIALKKLLEKNKQQIIKKKYKLKNKILNKITCAFCGNLFKVNLKFNSRRVRKTCSKKCHSKMSGGYREGSGRSKHGYYKGIYCGSTYELVWVIYQLDHNLNCERFPSCIEGNNIKYYPDFFDKTSNTIIEIKGYENIENVNNKIELAKSKGYNVIVLRKEDLVKEFKWVKNNYTYKEIFELYDNYKPKYKYTCDFCKKEISRNKKSKTKNIFCSRSCAGKGHTGKGNNSGINQYSKLVLVN